MTRPIQYYIRQQRGFRTLEEEVFVGLQLAADRLMAPWERTLRERADLTPVQYNVLRILRGAGAEGLWAGEIAARLIARSPDVTRLVDRLEKRVWCRAVGMRWTVVRCGCTSRRRAWSGSGHWTSTCARSCTMSSAAWARPGWRH